MKSVSLRNTVATFRIYNPDPSVLAHILANSQRTYKLWEHTYLQRNGLAPHAVDTEMALNAFRAGVAWAKETAAKDSHAKKRDTHAA